MKQNGYLAEDALGYLINGKPSIVEKNDFKTSYTNTCSILKGSHPPGNICEKCNAKFMHVIINGEIKIILVATQDIDAREEILLNYEDNFSK